MMQISFSYYLDEILRNMLLNRLAMGIQSLNSSQLKSYSKSVWKRKSKSKIFVLLFNRIEFD